MNHTRQSSLAILLKQLVDRLCVEQVDLVQLDEVRVGWEAGGDPVRAERAERSKARSGKGKQGEARSGMANEGEARSGMAKEGEARQGEAK